MGFKKKCFIIVPDEIILIKQEPTYGIRVLCKLRLTNWFGITILLVM